MSDSKNEIAWQKLFIEHDILNKVATDRQLFIHANDIIKYREPRLMAKFDHRAQLPKIFADNNLSILPVARGNYVISNFETYHVFDNNEVDLIKIDFPNHIESLDYKNITSEATSINCAFVCNILHDFIQEDELLPTVSGKMSSADFSFRINTTDNLLDVNVSNSQLEIDGGYEGLNTLNLIEAKNYISNDFLIRQLFYPYKLWSQKITKKVRPIFLTYTNGIFHLREYLFENPNHYNSIRLIRQKKYAIREGAINIETIMDVLRKASPVVEPEMSFPQANSFERVINLCELLNDKTELSREEITENYDFDERQTNYYTDAARYLGLVDKKRESNIVTYFLTPKGISIFKTPITNRQIEFAKLILAHKVFKQSLELYLQKGVEPTKEEVVEIMKSANLFAIESETTFYRRSSTILSWVNWILGLIEE